MTWYFSWFETRRIAPFQNIGNSSQWSINYTLLNANQIALDSDCLFNTYTPNGAPLPRERFSPVDDWERSTYGKFVKNKCLLLCISGGGYITVFSGRSTQATIVTVPVMAALGMLMLIWLAASLISRLK